jgi:hypothetical protein
MLRQMRAMPCSRAGWGIVLLVAGCQGAAQEEGPPCDDVEEQCEYGAESGSGACTPRVLASDQPGSPTARIAIDDARAYWTFGRLVADGVPENGIVNSAPLAGGRVTAVAPGEQYVPTAVAVRANDIFWIDDFWNRIMKAPKAGGTAVQVGQSSINTALVADDESLYWADYRDGVRGVFKAPVGGGEAIRLAVAEGQVQAIALDETHLYWSERDESTDTSRVMKVSIDGGEPVLLYQGKFPGNTYADLAAGADGVYWSGEATIGEGVGPGALNVKISRIPLEGGAPVTLVEEPGVRRVELDSNHLYWTARPGEVFGGSPGSVRKLPLSGGSVSTIASDQPGLSALAVNDANVCWLNFDGYGNSGEVVCREACVDGR